MFVFAIVGGGIVGSPAARALLKCIRSASLVVLGKEDIPARYLIGQQQSDVWRHLLQSWEPEARYAKEGGAEPVKVYQEKSTEHDLCGKLIVVCRDAKFRLFEKLHERSRKRTNRRPRADYLRVGGSGELSALHGFGGHPRARWGRRAVGERLLS